MPSPSSILDAYTSTPDLVREIIAPLKQELIEGNQADLDLLEAARRFGSTDSYLPLTRYLIGSAVALLEPDSITQLVDRYEGEVTFPSEVYDRSIVAKELSTLTSDTIAGDAAAIEAVNKTHGLNWLADRIKYSAHGNTQEPFTDMAMITGGIALMRDSAAELPDTARLDPSTTDSELAAIASHSSELHVANKVSVNFRSATQRMGSVPYVQPKRNLFISETGNPSQIKVGFTPRAKGIINDERTGALGCPADIAASGGENRPTVFAEYWDQIAGVLLQEGLTVQRDTLDNWYAFNSLNT